MKRCTFIICLTICSLLCLSFQSLSGQDWIRYYGQGQNAVCNSISNDYDKGAIIGGMVNNYKYLWIIKVDINGNILWNKKIGKENNDCGIGNIEKTADGGYILCGSWTLQNPSMDAFIIKLNPCAEIEWCKVLETPNNYDMGFKVQQTPEGDFVHLGGYFATNPVSNTSLFKFDANGNLIWHQFYPLDSICYQDLPYDLLIDHDGYLILTDRYYPNPGTTSPAIVRPHFTKTDTTGTVLWDLIYGIEDYYYGGPWCLKKSSSGAYYEAGRHLQQSMTESSPAFIKLTSDGVPLYDADVMSNVSWGGLSSIDILQDSLLVMVGGYNLDQNTSYDVFFKSDTLGNLRKIKIIPNAAAGYWDACMTFDNKFIAVGTDVLSANFNIVAVKVNSNLEYDSIYTQPFTYDSLCPHPIESETISPDCDNVIVKVDEPFKEPETTQLKVYPNPTDQLITIELPTYLVVTNSKGGTPVTTIYHRWSTATLQAIDIQGKIFLQQEVANSGTPMQVDVSDLPAGMYQFRLLYHGKQVVGRKVLVR